MPEEHLKAIVPLLRSQMVHAGQLNRPTVTYATAILRPHQLAFLCLLCERAVFLVVRAATAGRFLPGSDRSASTLARKASMRLTTLFFDGSLGRSIFWPLAFFSMISRRACSY